MAWTRRLYLCLALVRLYFALAPSYIHPDEHFQGPEIIAGELFSWNITRTWEFTSENPIRSYFPLVTVYSLPMMVLQLIANGDPSPKILFYAVRSLFYFFSIVYGDWALMELGSNKGPNVGLLLTASSWVTWTIQTRSFSNSVETVVLLWSLVFMRRIINRKGTSIRNCFLLAAFVVLGTFNRITFPAFLFIPGVQLLQHFVQYPLSFLAFTIPTALLTASAVVFDTHVYTAKPILSITTSDLIITPLNNLIYNSNTSNLAEHGLHPYWTHILANLPQLLGPALILLALTLRDRTSSILTSLPLQSAISGIITLSLFKHQEMRFLIPTVPLILSSISLPTAPAWCNRWLSSWVVFNLIFGTLMGIYHQGGVVPAQLYVSTTDDVDTVFWWKTYKPPTWLLGGTGKNITTVDLMGAKVVKLQEEVLSRLDCLDGVDSEKPGLGRKLLVAPMSAQALDGAISVSETTEKGKQRNLLGFTLSRVYTYPRHLNLDDMDFGDDGFVPTIERVIGRRGIAVYEVRKIGCSERPASDSQQGSTQPRRRENVETVGGFRNMMKRRVGGWVRKVDEESEGKEL